MAAVYEIVVDVDDKTCRCCQGELHRIGEDKSERLDIVPAQFRVLVTVRAKYACRKCEDGVLQAPAPARLIEGGLPSEATVAQVLVSKYADHLPLCRQVQIYARQGINLDRSTLADWVGHAAWHLRPLQARLLTKLKRATRLFADETTAPVLDPGRGRTKIGQLWAYAADDRPRGGSDPPGVAYIYAPAVNPNGSSPISKASKVSCRSTAMPVTASWPMVARSSWRFAGRMYGAASMNLQLPVRPRSPAKRSNILLRFTPSRKTSVAAAPMNVAPSANREAVH
jgi:transposase